MNSQTSQKDVPQKQLRQFGWMMGGCVCDCHFLAVGFSWRRHTNMGLYHRWNIWSFRNGVPQWIETDLSRLDDLRRKNRVVEFSYSVRDSLLWSLDAHLVHHGDVRKTTTSVTI